VQDRTDAAINNDHYALYCTKHAYVGAHQKHLHENRFAQLLKLMYRVDHTASQWLYSFSNYRINKIAACTRLS